MMTRAIVWTVALLTIAMIGVLAWPVEQRSMVVTLVAAALAVAGLLVPSSFTRALAVTLGVFALTAIAEPVLLVSTAGDPRIAWTALLAAVVLRIENLRVATLAAAGVIAATITPPSDISLLSVAPPVLLQILVCVIAAGAQLLNRPSASWWRVYRAIEPVLFALVAAAAVRPFARNGLTLAVLLAWFIPPALGATTIGLVVEALGSRRNAATKRAASTN